MKRLEGRAALVTGAASGIGRASAKIFAEEGAWVVCVDRAKEVEETAARRAMPSLMSSCIPCVMNVFSKKAVPSPSA